MNLSKIMLSTGDGSIKAHYTQRAGQIIAQESIRGKIQRLYGSWIKNCADVAFKTYKPSWYIQNFSRFFSLILRYPWTLFYWRHSSQCESFQLSESKNWILIRITWGKGLLLCLWFMERSMKFSCLLIGKTIILEIEGWSILYELLISCNPIS